MRNHEWKNDYFLNFYKQWIFIRCYEYSAIIISEITWYRVYANIDKKTWKIFLELWFPVNKEKEIFDILEKKWYFLRMCNKDWLIEEIIWNNKIEKDNKKLIEIKKQLIKM
jgi:hypothetical protein